MEGPGVILLPKDSVNRKSKLVMFALCKESIRDGNGVERFTTTAKKRSDRIGNTVLLGSTISL